MVIYNTLSVIETPQKAKNHCACYKNDCLSGLRNSIPTYISIKKIHFGAPKLSNYPKKASKINFKESIAISHFNGESDSGVKFAYPQ